MFDPGHKPRTPNTYLTYGVLNFDSKKQYLKRNSYNKTGIKLSNKTNMVDDSSLCSPPLWRTSPTRTPSPQRLRNNYRNLSPESKAQEVARGQKELMEMVKNMPESCYELTLKDLVEQQQQQQQHEDQNKKVGEEKKGAVKKVKSQKKMNRNGSHGGVDNGGFLLKMVFPTSFWSSNKKKKNSNSGGNVSAAKVSPRPSVDGSGRGKGAVDKEWWKIGFSSESSSNNSGSKSSSSGSRNSSRSSNRNNSETSCWSFLVTKRSRIAV